MERGQSKIADAAKQEDDETEECAEIESFFDSDDDGDENDENGKSATDVEIVIQSFSVAEVKAHDKVRFNTNNHWNYRVDPENPLRLVKVDSSERPEDYLASIKNVETRHWIDAFHSHYRVINIPPTQLSWMRRSSTVACVRAGQLSGKFADEFEETVRETKTGDTFDRCNHAEPTSGYFVRTDTVSLKGGVFGVGPYFNLETMVESAVTAYGGHQAVDADTKKLKFYLLPWLPNMHKFREFRIFVCCGRITAISQQSLYRANEILMPLSEEQRNAVIKSWCRFLISYVNDTVVPRLAHCLPRTSYSSSEVRAHEAKSEGVDEPSEESHNAEYTYERSVSVVMDVALVGSEPPAADLELCKRWSSLTPYFIEPNPFGFAYSSGSSLFSWVDDFAVLYGLCALSTEKVHFRYTSE